MPSSVMTPIYLDNAASTRVTDDVIALMTEVMRTAWGNPSASHPQGAAARAHIDRARQRLLAALGDPDGALGDVVWTSGCTEADALAIQGAAAERPGAIVVSSIEHPAVGETARRAGTDRAVIEVSPGPEGVLDPDAVAAVSRDAAVVAVLMVQNEVGLVQPIAAIANAVKRQAPGCIVHVDAAQALGKVHVDVTQLGADTVAIAGHKMHGPKGVGALWVRKGVSLRPLFVGGGQQAGLRGGTQDAPGAAGLGLAAELAVGALPAARARWLELADIVRARLERAAIPFRQLVPDVRRAPHILALAIPGVPASALRTVLSSRGVYVSTGSSCADGKHGKPSPVLTALAVPEDTGMVRLSFGLDTRADEVTAAADILADVIRELR